MGSRLLYNDDDPVLAGQLADELADLAWSLRADFQVTTSVPADEAVTIAGAEPSGVVILSDHGDSVFGGAAGDSTVLLEAVLRLGLDGRAIVPVVDPEAARAIAAQGEGARVSRAVGATLSGFHSPVHIDGTVRRVGSGRLHIEGLPDPELDMGATVVVDAGPVTLLISEHRGVGGNHPDVYRAFGIETGDYRGRGPQDRVELPVVRAPVVSRGGAVGHTRADPVRHRQPAVGAHPTTDVSARPDLRSASMRGAMG